MAGRHWEHHRELGAGGPGSPSSRDRSEGVWLEPGLEPPSAAGLISPGQEERAGPALPVEQVFLLCSLLLCPASCPPPDALGVREPPRRGGGASGRVRDHRGAPHGCPFVPRLLPASLEFRGWAWGFFPFPSSH